jgi:hypothetical protein
LLLVAVAVEMQEVTTAVEAALVAYLQGTLALRLAHLILLLLVVVEQ